MASDRWSTWRRTAIDRMSEDDVRWRSLGALFVAGGTLALASLLLPVDEGSRTLGIFLVGVCAVLSGAATIALAARLPPGDRWLSIYLAFGTLLITLAVALNDSPASAYALIYVWVGFDAFFFLGRRTAFAHLAFVGLCYGAALALVPGNGQAGAGRWLLLVGTVAVIGTLADLLRTRSEGLIAKLSDVARTDALTGLLNRRGFEERMANELSRARRSGAWFSLVVGDLDHFKSVNDRFGHHRGDEALRQFSDVTVRATRDIDGAARIGGEEFAVVLPGADEHAAFALAERLRRRARAALTEDGLDISVSFGVATFPRHGASPEELMRAADQALYLAKRLGRDRSVIYSAEVAASLRASDEPSSPSVEQLPAVLILAETLDLRDAGTALHSQTVGHYAEAIALELGLAPEHVERVRLAGLLHDIGKIGVPDPILRKAGPLDAEEWAEMRKHSELGARILAGANLDDISVWVLAHHERPDGTGYPAGLVSGDIPLEARILSVADAFEAMISDRVYRSGIGLDAAVQELRRHAGTQFDAGIVGAFLRTQASSVVPSQAISATTASAASSASATR